MPSDGQIARPSAHIGLSPGLHLSGQVGVSAYGGDLDDILHGDETGTAYIGGELIWQPSVFVSAGIGLRDGSFPMLTGFGRDRRRLQSTTLLLRLHPLGGNLSPYAVIGGHRTTGGSEPALGPVGGMGITLSLNRSIHLFGETTLMLAAPDRSVDAVDADNPFDQLGFASFGIRIANPGVRYAKAVELSGIDNPGTIEQGEEAEFEAHIEPRASLPIVYIWEFAPDDMLYGPTIRRTFTSPGLHNVRLIAWNAGGSDTRETDILVLPATGGPPATDIASENGRAEEPPTGEAAPDEPAEIEKDQSADAEPSDPAAAKPVGNLLTSPEQPLLERGIL